ETALATAEERVEQTRADIASTADTISSVITIASLVLIAALLYVAFLHFVLFRSARGSRTPTAG
ncbi:MAG TPA: hypothetical protein VFV33_19815, partial [Gemmatimonadaceae bacterium]|nr:hypothetical protein [Gemmatimonadaceae bacterium]